MRTLYYTLFISSFCVLTGSCEPEQSAKKNADNAPLMSREQKMPATPVAEPLSPGQTNVANFEGMVADFESKDRVIWQKPDMIIAMLGNLEGKTVADIGAGTGYFSFRMVPKAEKVIGIDIDQRFINFMDSVKVQLPGKYRTHFETRLGTPDNPLLKPNEADAAVLVNTYAYIEQRVQYLKKIREGLRDNGKILIIDFKKNHLPVGPPDQYKVSLAQVEQELAQSGFTVSKIDKTSLDYQYIVLAVKQ
jgi:SAM-dependent methyltransferase